MFAFVTQKSAQEVANVIQAFYKDPSIESFELSYHPPMNENEVTHLFVQPNETEQPIALANGDQIVQCQADDGSYLAIIVPGKERKLKPATVLRAF